MTRFSPAEKMSAPLTMEITEQRIKECVRYDPETKMFCVVDAIMLVKGCSRSAAQKTLRKLDGASLKVAENSTFKFVKFSGMRNADAPACTFSVLCEIIALLNSPTAAEFRAHAMRTFARALGGDLSLAADIERRAARLAGTEMQSALLEGTGAPPTSVLDVPVDDLRRALTLLEPEDPDVVRAASERTLDVDAFFETTFAVDPYGCVPVEIIEPLVRCAELDDGVDKKKHVTRAFVEKMCSDRGLAIARQRRFWNGAWGTRDYIIGLALADPAKSVGDAKKVAGFRRAIAMAEHDVMGPLRAAAGAHVRSLVAPK